jgi:hypothetical protein
MIYEAYLDESGCDNYSKVLVVGGYLIEAGQARLMDRKWRRVLQRYGIPHFHMVDCAHDPGNGVFAGMPKAKRVNVARKMIELINQHTAWGLAFACPPRRHVNKDGLRDPYTLALEGCLAAIHAVLCTEIPGESVSLFIEAGHKSAPLANRQIEAAREKGIVSKISSYFFVRKEEVPLVQASDILAWQVAKNIKSKIFERTVRANRGDFNALVRSKTSVFYLWLSEDREITIMDVSPHDPSPEVSEAVHDLFKGTEIKSPILDSWTRLPLSGTRPQGLIWRKSTTLQAVHRRT